MSGSVSEYLKTHNELGANDSLSSGERFKALIFTEAAPR